MTYFNYIIVERVDMDAICCIGVDIMEDNDCLVCINPPKDPNAPGLLDEEIILIQDVKRVIKYTKEIDGSVSEQLVYVP